MMQLEVDETVFNAFAFYSGILVLKMAIMGPFTSVQRLTYGVMWNGIV